MYGLQEEMGELTSTVEEPEKKSESQAMGIESAVSVPGSGQKGEGEKEKGEADGRVVGAEEGKKVGGCKSEEKAAKIQRLKSGFRLCKPQGTFLWPSSVALSPQVVVQVEDLLALPTPPSVSSSTSPPLPLLPPPPSRRPISPVKPLAEKRHVNLTPHCTTTLINLNELPSVSSSTNNGSRRTVASAATPSQPNHTLTITDVMSRVSIFSALVSYHALQLFIYWKLLNEQAVTGKKWEGCGESMGGFEEFDRILSSLAADKGILQPHLHLHLRLQHMLGHGTGDLAGFV